MIQGPFNNREARTFSPDKTINEVAAELGRSYESVYAFARTNKMPFRRLKQATTGPAWEAMRQEIVRRCKTQSPRFVADSLGVAYDTVLRVRRASRTNNAALQAAAKEIEL